MFQKVMLGCMCLMFLVIMFVIISFYRDSRADKAALALQNAGAAQAQNAQSEFMTHYEDYEGTWRIDKKYENGTWKSVGQFESIVGWLVDFRNLYDFGTQTNFSSNGVITVQLNADSVDLTSIGMGNYSTSNFVYSLNGYQEPCFVNQTQGVLFVQSSDGSFQLALLDASGNWQPTFILERA